MTIDAPAPASVDLSIVIVNYNSAGYTAHCLDSLRQARPALPYEVILVDNASGDGGADELERSYPEVQFIRSQVNRGVTGGNNMGIRAAHGRHILLLNNDTLVLPGTLEQAVSYLDQHPEVGGVGGNLLNADGSFQASYADFPSLWSEFLGATGLHRLVWPYYPSHPPGQTCRTVDWMGTAFMSFRRSALEAVGPVDEAFFMYSDETDLQYRLRAAGWAIVYLPDIATIHYGGKSSSPWNRRHLIYRGKLLFFQKHYGFPRTLLLRLLFAVTALAKAAFWASLGRLFIRGDRARQEASSYLQVARWSLRRNLAL